MYAELESVAWTDNNGRGIGNWRRYMKTAWNDELKKIRAARAENADEFAGLPIAR